MGTGYCEDCGINDGHLDICPRVQEPREPAGYDADLLKNLQRRVIELDVEVAQYKEAIFNYMSMGHAGEEHELVEMFMETHLPDEPDGKELES